jgi:plasmid stabilization system protein ParE
LKYYNRISRGLADEFDSEVRSIIAQAVANPLRFHVAGKGFRRANLRRFPYHILYEVHREVLRVMHIRHNKRHPDFNMQRQ